MTGISEQKGRREGTRTDARSMCVATGERWSSPRHIVVTERRKHETVYHVVDTAGSEQPCIVESFGTAAYGAGAEYYARQACEHLDRRIEEAIDRCIAAFDGGSALAYATARAELDTCALATVRSRPAVPAP